jgi:predicted nuclease with TOPRIM domain
MNEGMSPSESSRANREERECTETEHHNLKEELGATAIVKAKQEADRARTKAAIEELQKRLDEVKERLEGNKESHKADTEDSLESSEADAEFMMPGPEVRHTLQSRRERRSDLSIRGRQPKAP